MFLLQVGGLLCLFECDFFFVNVFFSGWGGGCFGFFWLGFLGRRMEVSGFYCGVFWGGVCCFVLFEVRFFVGFCVCLFCFVFFVGGCFKIITIISWFLGAFFFVGFLVFYYY